MLTALRISLILAITILVSGCTTQQAPARVTPVKPSVKRTAPKHAKKPEMSVPIRKPTRSSNKNTLPESPQVKQTGNRNNTERKNQDLVWAWPARGNVLTKFTAGQATFKGIDIAGSEGTPILAASDGEVVYSGNSLRGYGNLIIIRHNKNYLTAYAHNRVNNVREGDKVSVGQRIAEMGQTGTDKVKLHFEVRYQGKPIDPQEVLPTAK